MVQGRCRTIGTAQRMPALYPVLRGEAIIGFGGSYGFMYYEYTSMQGVPGGARLHTPSGLSGIKRHSCD